MRDAMADDRRLGRSDLYRRQRGKNLIVAGFLVAMVAIFFILTIVRMGPQG
ncbi:hypothetical protein BH11PSE3_BH11PSE3_30650 [soil metagenome]